MSISSKLLYAFSLQKQNSTTMKNDKEALFSYLKSSCFRCVISQNEYTEQRQMRFVYDKEKSCSNGETVDVIRLMDKDEVFQLLVTDLTWKTEMPQPKVEACVLLSLVHYNDFPISHCEARVLQYSTDQCLYDTNSNLFSRIAKGPPESQYPFEPSYIVCGSTGDMILKESVVEKYIVGPKQEMAAARRIAKWYKGVILNRACKTCEAARLQAQQKDDALSMLVQQCRNGSVGDIRELLRKYSDIIDINGVHPLTQKTALHVAADHHNNEVIDFLVDKGANPNMQDSCGYILHSLLKDTTPGAIETMRFFLSLHGVKADPDGVEESSDAIASSEGKRYWLSISRLRPSYRQDDLVKMGVPHLSRFIFALVGQPYAQRTLVKEIITKLANKEKYRRMVFVLGGNPGHGKTQSAKELSRVCGGEPEKDFLKVSCANVNSVFELFGASGAYQGAHTGSELNNFVVGHRNRLGVVNLDEFYRLHSQVRDAFFTTFDKGEWVDKKSSSAYQTKTLDCSKIIWVLTTNVFDNRIEGFFEKERGLFDKRNWRTLDRKVKKAFQGEIESHFGEAMARRLGTVIPFVPFSEEDRVAFIEKEIDDWRGSYAKPVQETKDERIRCVGNFNFTVDPHVVKHIASHYNKKQGATSLKDCIEEEIVDVINDLHIEGYNLESTTGRFVLTGAPGEEEIDMNWPVE